MTSRPAETRTLLELRHERGLSVEAVALLAEIDKGTVSRLERGLIKARPATVVKLAKALAIRAERMDVILNGRGEA
jgi:transcriptional regulator with XRE-family HTH domain